MAGEDCKDQVIIGWREAVDIPEWNIKRLHAKIDTGACNSAVHATNIKRLDDDHVQFTVVVRLRPVRRVRKCIGRIVREAAIKPSTGETQERILVSTTVVIGDIEREIEMSLVSRDGMRCRMLIGRAALSGILVDPEKKYLLTDPPKKKA